MIFTTAETKKQQIFWKDLLLHGMGDALFQACGRGILHFTVHLSLLGYVYTVPIVKVNNSSNIHRGNIAFIRRAVYNDTNRF